MSRKIQIALGLCLSAALLLLLFWGADWNAVWEAVRQSDPGWSLAATVVLGLTFVVRVQRWTYVVRAEKPIRWRHLFAATQIGFLGNFVLPGRLGELLRAGVLARMSWPSFPKALAFAAFDRILDLVAMVFVLVVTLLAFRPTEPIVLPEHIYSQPIPPDILHKTAGVALAVVFAGAAALAVLLWKRAWVASFTALLIRPISPRWADRLQSGALHFLEGFGVLKRPGLLSAGIFFSILTWLVCVLYWECMLRMFGLEHPWYSAWLIQSLLAIAVSIPGAPGFFGQFHIAIVAAMLLTIQPADLDAARALAIVAHAMNYLAVLLLGALSLNLERVGLFEIKRTTEAAGERRPEEM